MKTRVLISGFLTLIAAPAVSQTAALCVDDRVALAERVAACEAELQRAPDPVVVLDQLGQAYLDADDPMTALTWFDRSLAEDPTGRRGLVGRSQALDALDRFDEAEVTLRALVDNHPGWYWGHYRLGRVLIDLDRPAEAMAPLETSLSLDSEYIWSWVHLAMAHGAMDQDAEAGAAWRGAIALDPLDARFHRSAFHAFRRAGMAAEANYHASIGHTLNPNDLILREFVSVSPAPPMLDPMPWIPPEDGMTVRYLSVLLPEVDDSVEASIDALANVFSGSAEPVPESAAILRLTHAPLTETRFATTAVVEEQASDLGLPEGAQPRYYAMFPFDFQPRGPDGPMIHARFDGPEPSALWPLRDGATAGGQGRYVLDCTAGMSLPVVMMGCTADLAEVEMGDFNWQASVVPERVRVPMGLFDAYRIDLELTARIRMMGTTRELPYAASFWVAPEAGTWVARRFSAGDQVTLHQAMEILPNDG